MKHSIAPFEVTTSNNLRYVNTRAERSIQSLMNSTDTRIWWQVRQQIHYNVYSSTEITTTVTNISSGLACGCSGRCNDASSDSSTNAYYWQQ
jgi:hypothetical protein